MMPGRAWGADSIADEGIIAGNLPGVLNAIKRSAQARELPRVALAHGWHRDIHAGVASVPASHYLGAPRGSKHPDLEAYEVAIRDSGGRTLGEGTPARQVSGELRSFERSLRQAVGALDKQIPPGQKPADENELLGVIELAAIAHGEWVRIHPYANGNGRVARIWANWVAIRYGLPPFIRIKPRPAGLLYQQAAHESMDRPPGHRGDHTTTTKLFLDLLVNGP